MTIISPLLSATPLLPDPAATGASALGGTPTALPTFAIVGLGYVGLPTAVALVSAGSRVIGIDIHPDRLDAIESGRVDLVPEDFDRLRPALDTGRFDLTTDSRQMTEADVVMICVPTPVDRHRVPELHALQQACATVVQHTRAGQTIVLTSTSYVGTTRDLVVAPLEAAGWQIGTDVHVAFSPERIDPGNRTHLQEDVPRVVGGVTDACGRRAAQAISAVAPQVHVVSSPEAAELTKLYENIFRAVNIALANEIADIAGALELDVAEVIDAAATKPYGFMPFRPGPGVGGHCIPCDPHYLLWQLRAMRVEAPVIDSAMTRIAARPTQVVARAIESLAANRTSIVGARVLVVGVTYKPDVQDCRESSALEIIELLGRRGAVAAYVDPYVDDLTLPNGTSLTATVNPEGSHWDLIVVHTRHVIADLDWTVNAPLVLDATYRMDAAPNRIVV